MEYVHDIEIDLREETDDENNTDKSESIPKDSIKPFQEMKTDVLVDFTENYGSKNIEQIETTPDSEKSNATTNIRNYPKLLEKAIEEIKKGGSLKSVSLLYNIPEEVLYQKLISRSLPKETELLTSYEENNLVRWILRSNENNGVVTKQCLMERVGRMKRVLSITPIFCRSKFGKMWYDYFLRTHSEILELEGIILPSNNRKRTYAKRIKKKASDHTVTIKNIIEKKKQHEPKGVGFHKRNFDLVSLYGITEVTVVLQDFRKLKSFGYTDEGNGCFTKIGAGSNSKVKFKDFEESVFNKSDLEEDFAGFENVQIENSRLIGKDVSNVINSEKEVCINKNKWCIENWTCKKCNKTFSHQTKLKKHFCIHHISKEKLPYTCNKCMKGFANKYYCMRHMQNAHHNEKLIKCDKCDKSFKYQSSMLKHVRKHHNGIISESTFVCDICSKEFNYKQSLDNHITYIHLKDEKPFPCDICGKRFIKPSLRARHRLKHSKIKTLPCPCCPKTFAKKYLLQEHIDICSTKCDKNAQKRRQKKVTEDVSEEIIIVD